MTVSELISVLQKLDKDKNIFVLYDRYQFQSIVIDKVNSLSDSELDHIGSCSELVVSSDDYFIDAY